jgi:hypothetical protein
VNFKFKSFALWAPEVYTDFTGDHITTDTHQTSEEAYGVCNKLNKYGFGGNGPKPLRTWVVEVKS